MSSPNATNLSTAVTYLPDQTISEWKDEDYIRNLRFIASRWNMPVYRANPWAVDFKELGLPLGFSSRCIVWRNYYDGIQGNRDYSQAILKEDGGRKALKMFRGKDIFKYVNYTIEPIIEISKHIPKIVSCNIISENVVSKRRFMQDFGKFMADQVELSQYMNEKFKMYYETGNGQKFLQSANTHMQAFDFREEMADGAVNVARDIFYRNYLGETFIDNGKDALITGLAGCKVSIFNGYTMVERIPSDQAVFCPTTTGDQHRQDPYGGRVRFMTVQDIAATFGSKISPEMLGEIKTMAYSQGNLPVGWYGWNYYNNTVGSPTFNWYSLVDNVPRIAVVEGQWASYRLDDANKFRQCLRQGTLIGNKWLIDEGITENQTKDWRNPHNTELDYIFVQPMSVFGKNMGIPEILANYQNRVDFLQTKLDEWINQTKGTFYIINGSYLSEGVTPSDVMADISDMRIHVSTGMDIDGDDKAQKLMEAGAIEMPRDTVNVINQIAMYRGMMDDILNIPSQARGQLEGYQGTKTLNMQISQSNKGTRYFYDPMYTFFQRVMQKAVDKFKTATLDNENFEYSLIVSDSQTEIFKATKDFGLSQYAIYMGFEDVADEGYKQRQLDMMFAFAQNPNSGYTMDDYAALECMYTKSEIKNYLQFRSFEIKQERMAQEAAAAEQTAAQTQVNNQTVENVNAMQQEGSNKREAAKIESNEAIAAAKIEADLIKSQQKTPAS